MSDAEKDPYAWKRRLEAHFPLGWLQSSFSCGPGWEALLRDLVTRMKATIPLKQWDNVRIAQIKEKFGTLSFYMYTDFNDEGLSDRVHALVAEARKLSEVTCESCGRPGQLACRDHYWSVKCASCADKESRS